MRLRLCGQESREERFVWTPLAIHVGRTAQKNSGFLAKANNISIVSLYIIYGRVFKKIKNKKPYFTKYLIIHRKKLDFKNILLFIISLNDGQIIK